MSVPVVDKNQQPLMPCSEKRARKMIQCGKATPFWKHGVFCIRLNVEPSHRNYQDIVVGIDPGSKKEGYTVKSEAHTLLNIQADAVTWVKDAVATRSMMRNHRRQRKTPCRKNKMNRARRGKNGQPRLGPSTKARWQWKLRVAACLSRIFPIMGFIVEDVMAETRKNCRRWNKNFSPLEVGKKWFYEKLAEIAPVSLKQGWETAQLRKDYGLKKSSDKMAETFSAHCVDSWVLAADKVGGHVKPENTRLLLVTPLRFYRRQLHYLVPGAGGKRRPYGGTMSHGFKRGSLVLHQKRGLTYVGGTYKDRISLHSLSTGTRLCQNARPSDCKFLGYNTWRTRWASMGLGIDSRPGSR